MPHIHDKDVRILINFRRGTAQFPNERAAALLTTRLMICLFQCDPNYASATPGSTCQGVPANKAARRSRSTTQEQQDKILNLDVRPVRGLT